MNMALGETKWVEKGYTIRVKPDSNLSPYKALGKRRCKKCGLLISGVGHALFYAASEQELTVWCKRSKVEQS